MYMHLYPKYCLNFWNSIIRNFNLVIVKTQVFSIYENLSEKN